MIFLRILFILAILASAFCQVSCEMLDSSPQPKREKFSSMPHNMPAPWEGQAGMPGFMGGQY